MKSADAIAHLEAAGVAHPAVIWNDARREWTVFSGERVLATHPVLRNALKFAGYPIAAIQRYGARGIHVYKADEQVATASTASMATRIAKALNVWRD